MGTNFRRGNEDALAAPGGRSKRSERVGPKHQHLMSCPRNKHIFRCDQNGPPARREEGAYPERYVTGEQRSRRPIFIATLWAAASWLFFRVARSSRIDSDMIVARALKNSQLTCGERHAYFGDRTLMP